MIYYNFEDENATCGQFHIIRFHYISSKNEVFAGLLSSLSNAENEMWGDFTVIWWLTFMERINLKFKGV